MGHWNRHYSLDPHSHGAVWGAPISKANFCEEDYQITYFIAEFINTLTNVAYVFLALRHPRRPGTQGGPLLGFDTLAAALFVLGINSAVFHATLHQPTQFCDELAMFLLGGALVHGVYTIDQPAGVRALLRAAIALTLGAASFQYVMSADIVFHVYVFNTMLALVGPRTLWLVFGRGHTRAERGRFMKQWVLACVVLTTAYGLWWVDLEYCQELRRVREVVGLPLGFVLELHGWWHVLTAVGACEYIKLIRDLAAPRKSPRSERAVRESSNDGSDANKKA